MIYLIYKCEQCDRKLYLEHKDQTEPYIKFGTLIIHDCGDNEKETIHGAAKCVGFKKQRKAE